MSLLDRVFDLPTLSNKAPWDLGQVLSDTPIQPLRPGPEMKAAFDMVRTGVVGRPQYPNTDIESLQTAYTRSEIVYAAVNAKVTAAIDPRLVVQLRTAKGEWEEEPGHPLRRLIMQPNDEMDEGEFAGAALTGQDTSGWFYAEIVRGANNLPIELHPLNPAKIALIPGDRGKAKAYEFKEGTHKEIIPAEDMIAWRKPDPRNRFQGLAPLAVCLGAVDADNAQTDFIRAFFNNGGVPSGIFKVLNRTLSQEQADEIKAKWNASRSRALGNQQTTAVLDQNGEYQRIGANLGELQGDSLREFTETRVSMVFGVPPFIIYSFAGIQHNTYSNSEEAWKQFWASTMTPWFKSWRTFLSRRLLSEFVSQDLILGERVRLNWDMSQVAALGEDLDKMHTRARENFKAGGLLLNEFRAIIGEDADPQGDYYIRPFNLIPVALGTTADEEEEPVPTGEEPAKQSSVTLQQRKVMAKAKRGRQTIERRMEQDIKKLLLRDYNAVATAIEQAA